MILLNKRLLIVPLIFLFLGLYIFGALKQATVVNTNMESSDQSAYMSYARQLRETNYSYVGERNRMPLYPFLQSLHYKSEITDEDFFSQGKKFNILLSIIALVSIYLIISHLSKNFYNHILILITAFTVFIFKAGFFQAEVLFYFLTFFIFALVLRLFQKPSYLMAVLVGLLFGIAQLTKASIIPGLIISTFFLGAMGIESFFRNQRTSTFVAALRSGLHWLFIILLIAFFFLLTVFPYIRTSKEIYGRYFYNVNSTFYIWYDSWEEAKEGTRAHGDREGWPDMPEGELPTFSKYISEHTTRQIGGRFLVGAKKIVNAILDNYGYGRYVIFYLSLFIIVGTWQWRKSWRSIVSRPFEIAFVLAYLAVYFLLYAWYAPIGGANRLILALFLPFMYSLGLGLQGFDYKLSRSIGGYRIGWLTAINLLVLAFIFVDIFFILRERVITIYGGG